MSKIIKGKYLVRKSKLSDGQPVLTISGIFYPVNFNIEDIKDDDEMWVSTLLIENGIRFTDPVHMFSPEEFLTGFGQSPAYWKVKTHL